MHSDVKYTEYDREGIKILADFLPDKIFDAHMHVFDSAHLPMSYKVGERDTGDLDAYHRAFGEMLSYPRVWRANMITSPDSAMREKGGKIIRMADEFLIGELNKSDLNVGEIIVSPLESACEIEKRLTHPRIRGLKVYFFLSAREKHGDESPDEYIPEGAWEVADKYSMPVTIHLVRSDALADPFNYNYIIDRAKKYKNAKIVLAHAGRAFASYAAIEGAEYVRKYENVLFDLSAICEPSPMAMLMKTVGVSRIMWGTDYPSTVDHGRAISVGRRFMWLGENVLGKCWLYAIENLMAVRDAAIIAKLSKTDVDRIFYNTAASVFKV